jgi:hypothetical protein
VKIWAEADEFYPWYYLKDDVAYAERFGYTVLDVPEETVKRWREAIAAAVAVQAEIRVRAEGPNPVSVPGQGAPEVTG